MVLYDNLDNSIKQRKQKLNNSHIRNLKIMNVLNLLVMLFLIVIDVFLLIKGIFTGMPNSCRVLLIIFLIAQIGSLVIFLIKRFARASMVTKVGIMIICFLPIIPYFIYLSIGNNLYIACLLARIIGLVALAMLLFNTKTTNDKKTFGVKGIPLAIASIFALVVIINILISTTNRKIIYSYDKLYDGYVVSDVLSGKGNVEIKNDTVAISANSLKNVSGNLVIPKNVKYIAEDAFLNSNITSLTIYSDNIELMDAVNNSNIDEIYLESDNAKIDIEKLDKNIDIICDRLVVDKYRSTYRKYDYLFVPKVNENEYYVCFNGTTLPVYIYTKPESLNEPSKDSLPNMVDGKKVLYDGYYISGKEIDFPYNVNSNTKITCYYSYIYNITYDFSGCEDSYDLPDVYYDKLGKIELPILSQDGYQFKGWYNVDEYGNYTKEFKSLDKTINSDINLKAKFLKEFTVKYNTILDNATIDGEKEVIYTEEDVIELKTPTIEGFTFDGWYLDSTYNVEATTYLNKDTTLYAKWNINKNVMLSPDIDKTFDNQESNVSFNVISLINDVSINYAIYDIDNNLITQDNNFNVINASDSNKYYAIVTLNYNDIVIEEYKTNYIDVNINKAKYDMSNISITDTSITYDGSIHKPKVSGLPRGIDNITITYNFSDGIKDVGTKELVCHFDTLSENYEIPEDIKAKITITPRKVTINWSSVLEFEYDGQMKFPSYQLDNVLPSDIEYIKCNEKGRANGVGEYEAEITSLEGVSGNIYKNYILDTDSNLKVNYKIVSKVNIIEGIIVDNETVVYDGLPHKPKVTIIPSGVEAIYSIEPVNVGTYTVIVTFKYTNNENENIGNEYKATVSITQREIDLEWKFDTGEIDTIVFDGKIHVPNYEIKNIVGNDTISLNYSSIKSVNAGNYTIDYQSIEGIDKDNYKLPKNTKYEYTITPKAITIDLDSLGFECPEPYKYNGKNQYPQIDKDKLPDNVAVNYEGYGKDAGTYTVTAIFSINSNNYVIDKNTRSMKTEVVIDPIVAEIRWGQTSFIHDFEEHIPTATLNNLLSGDKCNVTITSDRLAIDVGNYVATILALDNSNYVLPKDSSLIEKEFTIEQQIYNFKYIFDDVTVEYDGNYHSPEVKIIGDDQPSWLKITYSSEGIKDAGVMTVSATFESTDPTYEVPQDPITATITITAREAEIVFDLSENIYTGKAIYPEARVSNLVDGDELKVILNSGINNINVGNYVVYAIEIEGNNNYKISNPVAYSYEIKKATYDVSNLVFRSETYEYDGYPHRPSIIAKDESIGTTIKGADGFIVTVSYTEGLINVGTKLITATFTASENYNNIPSMTATVTITPKEVDLKWNGQTFTYTGSIIKPECILSGLVLNDTCGFTVNAQGVNVGKYTATVSNLTNANYKLPINATYEYEIVKATINLDVEFKETTKVYDSTPLYPEIVGTIPENVEVSYEGLSSDAGTHFVKINFTVSDNYHEIQSRTVEVIILQREISVNWTNLEAVYTGNLSYPSYELTNIISGDECILTISGAGINVGEYDITVVGLSNNNYVLDSYDDVTYRIIRAEYDMSGITFNDVELVYNGTMQKPALLGSLPSGVMVSYSDGATNVSDGIVTVTASFTSTDDNYNNPKPMKATIKIVEKEISAVWSNITVPYDGLKHSPQAVLQGLISNDTCTPTISGYGINADEYECEIVLLSNTNYVVSDATKYQILTITKIDYDMADIKFVDQEFVYDGTSHQATLNGNLASVIGLDNTSPEIDEIKGVATNVSDGKVLCQVTFKSTSNNYNAPSSMSCYISITPIVLDLSITLDTDSSVSASTQSWNNCYSISATYDGKEHTVNIEYDKDSIVSNDIPSFSINGTFKNYNSGNAYEFDILSDNLNYLPAYSKLRAYITQLNAGYWWGNGLTPGGWWPYDVSVLTEDVVKVYIHTELELEVETTTPTVYGSYKITYRSKSENVIISNPSQSSQTYDVELSKDSLNALIDYYDSNNDGLITDYPELARIESLYNELGESIPEIETIIKDSYAKYMESAEIVEFKKVSGSVTATSDYCTSLTGSMKDGIEAKTYYGHKFETALKMESSTNIVLDLENSGITYIIMITDSASKRIRINSQTFTTNSDGTLKLKFNGDPTKLTITKYDVLNLYGIILL